MMEPNFNLFSKTALYCINGEKKGSVIHHMVSDVKLAEL